MENGPPSADDEKLLANSWKIFDNEAIRRNSIDTRAAALMPAITLAATLVTGVGFTVLKDASLPASARWIILLSFLLSLVYLIRTMLLLFLIHGEISRHTPDPSDLVTAPTVLPAVAAAGAVSVYDRRLACKIMSYTVNNYRVNNVWSDALYVAQRAFRNAIIAVVLGAYRRGNRDLFEHPDARRATVYRRMTAARREEAVRRCHDLPGLPFAIAILTFAPHHRSRIA